LNNDSSTISNDEEEREQYDFDEWFEEQMDIHDNISEKSSGKYDNFVQFLDNITSNSLIDYENEIPPIPPEMQDAIQLLSLLNTSTYYSNNSCTSLQKTILKHTGWVCLKGGLSDSVLTN